MPAIEQNEFHCPWWFAYLSLSHASHTRLCTFTMLLFTVPQHCAYRVQGHYTLLQHIACNHYADQTIANRSQYLPIHSTGTLMSMLSEAPINKITACMASGFREQCKRLLTYLIGSYNFLTINKFSKTSHWLTNLVYFTTMLWYNRRKKKSAMIFKQYSLELHITAVYQSMQGLHRFAILKRFDSRTCSLWIDQHIPQPCFRLEKGL